LALARERDFQRSPLDAGALLRDAEEHWRGLLAARGRRMRVVLDDDLPEPVVAEPAIRQIVDVLISNAERHGAGLVTVAARASAPGALVVEVSDEGPATLDRQVVFERRTDGSPGVGLALARSLAEAEHARLVLDRPGPRPMFSLVIPTDDGRD
jgi:signal transduction histidine kinase